MIKRIKIWYAKQSDYDLRRMAIALGVITLMIVLGVMLFWDPFLSSDEGLSVSVERSFSYAELWEEDRESVLILGGLLLLALFFAAGIPNKFSEVVRRNNLVFKHPWVRKIEK